MIGEMHNMVSRITKSLQTEMDKCRLDLFHGNRTEEEILHSMLVEITLHTHKLHNFVTYIKEGD